MLGGATACLGPVWPVSAQVSLLAALAFCALGWNGVYMAEVVRAVGPREAGLATGGVLVFNFAGVVFGPAAFAAASKALGGLAVTYALFAILPCAGAIVVWRSMARRSQPPPEPPARQR